MLNPVLLYFCCATRERHVEMLEIYLQSYEPPSSLSKSSHSTLVPEDSVFKNE